MSHGYTRTLNCIEISQGKTQQLYKGGNKDRRILVRRTEGSGERIRRAKVSGKQRVGGRAIGDKDDKGVSLSCTCTAYTVAAFLPTLGALK